MQTAEYAAAVIRAEHPDAPAAEIDRRVELRMRRQREDSPPHLWVVLDEAALRRPIGGAATFKAQLDRLAEAAKQPGNTVQILRFEAGEHGSMGSSFSILDFPEPADPGVVYLETRAGSLYLEGQEVREYGRVFDHLRATAKGARESRTLISEAINDLREDGRGVDTVNTARVTWRKSTRSNGSGDCVEVADLGGTIGVRDSKDIDGGILTFEPARWSAFVAGIKQASKSS